MKTIRFNCNNKVLRIVVEDNEVFDIMNFLESCPHVSAYKFNDSELLSKDQLSYAYPGYLIPSGKLVPLDKSFF